MSDHYLEMSITYTHIKKRFICTAKDLDDVTTSQCRWFCATCEEDCSCGVETWTNHLDYCRETEGWFDGVDLEDAYDGPETAFQPGLVEFTWDGDTYCWHYAPAREPDEPLFVLTDDGQISQDAAVTL